MGYGIVAQAGGHLTVGSKVGEGTTFPILLPRTRETEGQSAADSAEHEGPSGRQTILIVEDDRAVMQATAAALRKRGYTVLTASNYDEGARRLAQPRPDGTDLVLSDVVVPTAQRAGICRAPYDHPPGHSVIFMTGYSEYPVLTESGDKRIANHRAPLRPRDLLFTAREVLDNRAQSAV